MKIKDLSDDEKPRERLKKYGPGSLTDIELLALILRQGSKKESIIEISRTLLRKHTLKSLSRKNLSELTKINGIGETKASQIIATFELARRLASQPKDKKKQIKSARDVFRLFHPEMSTLKQEHLKGIYLNTRRKIIREKSIFIGSVDASIIHPREIFSTALSEGATSLILLHNHPSGDPTPSQDDIYVTSQILKAGKLLEINLIDHVIIGDKKYFSFREKGLI